MHPSDFSANEPWDDFHLGHMIRIVSGKFRARVDANANLHDLTGMQTHILHYLCENGGTVQQKEIVKFLHVSHPTVVGFLSRMEKKGLITIEQDPGDHRNRIVRATPKAEEVVQQAYEDMLRTDAAARQGMSDAEYEELKRLLKLVYDNLQALD